uniref:Uncharacterized protein n=1 Tax=Aegilops tauschii subsp. strangulata TaxID=200361 RepID=A0A453QJQ0_AEGTS
MVNIYLMYRKLLCVAVDFFFMFWFSHLFLLICRCLLESGRNRAISLVCAKVPVTIRDLGCTCKTFPNYFDVLSTFVKNYIGE